MREERKTMDRIRTVPEHTNACRMHSSVSDLPGFEKENSFDFSRMDLILRKFPTSGGKEQEMTISGQKIGRPFRIEPKMAFWSQGVSTRMPEKNNGYGFRLGLQRSMTEVKLLGESMYSGETRDVQSANPAYSRDLTQYNIARLTNIKPTGSQTYLGNDCRGEVKQRGPPPPSRESHAQTPANVFKKVPKIPEQMSETRTSNPSEINLNLKHTEIIGARLQNNHRREQLKVVLSRSARSPDGRQVRENVKMLSFKTRAEATKHYQKFLEDKKNTSSKTEVPNVHVVSELERSYTFVPTVKEEVDRPQTDVKTDHCQTGAQYAKSTYGLNLQNSISQKVLNRQNLPIPFRKNHNTFLKHYGTQIVDDNIRHYNTPETYFTCTPVSLH